MPASPSRCRPLLPAAVVGLSCAAGCVLLPGGDASSPAARSVALRAAARSAEELGMSWHTTDGAPALHPVRMRVASHPVVLDFHTRPGEEAPPVVRVRVNDRTTYALIDTGAAGCLADWPGARRLGIVPLLPPGERGGLMALPGQGLGLPFRQYLGIALEVRAGDTWVRHVPVGILDADGGMVERGHYGSTRLEILLGMDFLRVFDRVSFDFPRERLVLDPPAGEASARSGPTVSASLKAHGIPVIEMELEGHGGVDVGLDTGGSFALWIPGRLAAEWRLPRALTARPTYAAGVGGVAPSTATARQTLRLGDLVLRDLPAVIGPQGGGRPDLPCVLLGHRAMRDLRITLDFAGGVAHIRRS